MELERKNSSKTINKTKRKLSLALKAKFIMRHIVKLRELNIPHFQHEVTRRIIAPQDGMSRVTANILTAFFEISPRTREQFGGERNFKCSPCKSLPSLRKIGKGRLKTGYYRVNCLSQEQHTVSRS